MQKNSNGRSHKCVIFDFAGTLCSEPYFKLLDQESRNAVGELVFGKNSEAWADPWMRGDICSRDVAEYLSRHLPYSAAEIVSVLSEACSRMTFNSAVYDYAVSLRQSGIKTALVTLNMDVFSAVVVPEHKLDKIFDIVVNSADIKTLKKDELWELSFERLGGFRYTDSLLIDDATNWCETFQRRGGVAYQYEHESAFRNWLKHGC